MGGVRALIVTAFYLVLSGAEVATQRSYIMIAIVLMGVMLDRPALTIRTLTHGRALVLFLAPQAVVHPSFQMSFAATLALVAAYERGVPWVRAGADSSLGSRAALWGVNEITSLIIASLVPAWRRRHTRPTISIGWRPTASSPTCSPCRSFPPG